MVYQQAWTAIPAEETDKPVVLEDRDYEYPSLPAIVNPALSSRILPWLIFQNHWAGSGFWAVMAWYNSKNNSVLDMYVDDPAIWIDKSEQAQNGDGWLVYPGNLISKHSSQSDQDAPVASLRLELWRQGLEDYKYLKILENNANSQEALDLLAQVDQLLPTVSLYDRDPQSYIDVLDSVKSLLNNQTLDTTISPIDWSKPVITGATLEDTPLSLFTTVIAIPVAGRTRRKITL